MSKSKFCVGTFVHNIYDAKTEKMKLLIIEDFGDGYLCCRYVHYKELKTHPHRKMHESELVLIKP